jgi:hypothetical protein
MTDIFPQRNLPGEAEEWGRAHDRRVVGLESEVLALQQSVQGQNRNSASSLASLARQIDEISQVQADLLAQSQALRLQSEFLRTQTASITRSTSDSFTGASPGTTWRGFDPNLDCALTVTTGTAGRLLIQASANLSAGGITALLAIEVVGVTGPSYPGPYSTYITNASAGVSRIVAADLSPNTTYTVRLRRGYSDIASGVVIWRDQSLVVTRS